MDDAKLLFPRVRQVRLDHFSLYTLKPTNVIGLNEGVFCLAGANALGKSTFLAALNYCLTGIVPDPKREFVSVKKYTELGGAFADLFFSGRIQPDDRDDAAVSIVMDVGPFRYDITRSVFEPSELRKIRVVNAETAEVLYDGADASDDDAGAERHHQYSKLLTEHVGLQTFDQFVFLQHFLFTFDESRHLLLWDPRVLTQILYLSIGSDYEKAERADRLRREVEKAASRARNRNYAASNVRARIEELRDALADNIAATDYDPTALKQEHERLQQQADTAEEAADLRRRMAGDAELQWLNATARLSSLQSEFARAYSNSLSTATDVSLNPTVARALAENTCAVCHATHPSIAVKVKSAIAAATCPFCNTALASPSPTADESMLMLVALDQEIASVKQSAQSAQAERERQYAEQREAEEYRSSMLVVLRAFEAENEAALAIVTAADSGIGIAIARLQEEMQALLAQKKHEYGVRDQKKKELLALQAELQRHYIAVETEFVPAFRELAGLFLGIDVDISLTTTTAGDAPALSLLLSLRGQARRQTYQLSESQRFFVDIALRMAMTTYMARGGRGATLFIDTPEGSLDIAYESKAGEMFAQFVRAGQSIVMTANVNTSQLLKRLARQCGRSHMTLLPMTSWTELTDVQLHEAPLFTAAYKEIERELDYGDSDSGAHA